MKTLLLSFFFLISSCALYQDFKEADINWLGSGKPRSPKTQEASTESTPYEPSELIEETPVATKKNLVPFENMVSKNWDYTESDKNHTASTSTSKKDANLIVTKLPSGEVYVDVVITEGTLFYREGHSIDVILDGVKEVQEVHPTWDAARNLARIFNSEAFAKNLKGKKNLKVELIPKGEKARIYEFDVQGLQDFFTTT